MSIRRGRARRPDDWPSSHVRARADLSDRLDASLEPTEAGWLADHLEACPECGVIADAYAAQRLELRALRDRTPTPPRDLWALTAAAIESESRFRDRGVRATGWRDRRVLAPSAAIAAALVVVVAVATLTSSQRFNSGGTAGSQVAIAAASQPPLFSALGSNPEPTRIPVTKQIAFVARDPAGSFTIKTKHVDSVCPGTSTTPCDDSNATVDHPVNLDQNASTVFGSSDNSRLIVVNDPSSANSGSISVVPISSDAPGATPTPTPTVATASGTSPSVSPSGAVSTTPSVPASPRSAPPKATPTPRKTPTPSDGGPPLPSVAVTATPDGPIEIANDVVLVGQSAAYSPNGNWFAFTARPVSGALGPDIFVWKVGDRRAHAVTTDHRSVFGSWTSDVMVASTVVDSTKGTASGAATDFQPVSYLLNPATNGITALPQTGQAWRPAVDPTGRLAVYWAGTVRATGGGYAADTGRLVLGDWGTGVSAPADAAAPTPIKGDQTSVRHETTIAAGRVEDWDARWDDTGTHLAVWIADPESPGVGSLSLYAVDSFDGKIDLKKPLLNKKRAIAGYSIANGQLVWAEPSAEGSTTGGQIQLLAWTDEGVGVVSTGTGPVIVIR
jgi:hypothetical protein